MPTLTPFNFEGQQVRVVTIDNEPWLVGTDVARCLGYANPTDALGRVHPDDKQTATLALSEGSRTVARDRTLVNESGMYLLVLGSTLASARAFQRWVTSEVLPQIRRTGSYSATPQLTRVQLLAAAVLEADQIMKEQADTIETQRVELAAAAPKVHAWDGIVSGAGDYTITDAAKVLARAGVKTGPRILHQQMMQLGWLYKNQRDKWTAKQGRVNDGCLAERARYYTDEDGVSTLATPQVRITAKGLEKLRDALAPQQSLAVSA